MNYYSEWDPYAAQWIRNLIDAGLIPPGHVDTRSITDVQPSDLAGYRQCHFFAGIAGWSHAARLAGWPDDRELWTGSAPCQPFSVAGKGKAQDDDRHLWPHFLRLIRARRPAVVMGEQVAAAVGKNWLDGVSADLEAEDYACRAVVVPACAVDAPHRRDRLWFVAHANGARSAAGLPTSTRGHEGLAGIADHGGGECVGAAGRSPHCGPVADADRLASRHGCAINGGCDQGSGAEPWAGSGGSVGGCDVADTIDERFSRERVLLRPEEAGRHAGGISEAARRCAGSQWSSASWLIGHDGKARRFEPSIRLLAHGVPGRMGRLRAYGNAIVPEVAAEVIGAYMDCYPDPDEQLRAALATN
ncbi:TPA: DNA cytosine methyltransferase [Stenotrophomonas maltophilia]